jgi:hypothetical protein
MAVLQTALSNDASRDQTAARSFLDLARRLPASVPPQLPTAAWINKPTAEEVAH